MAFIDFSQGTRQSAVAGTAGSNAAERFTAIERRVIAIARGEDVAAEGSAMAHGLAKLLGIRRKPPLADPRLEALRRFASQAFHHPDRLGDADMAAFAGAGFSPGHARLLIASARGRRAQRTLH